MPVKQAAAILALLFFSEVGLIAQPTFLFPADGPEQIGLPTSFTIRVSRIRAFLPFYDIELSKDISFSSTQLHPDYQVRLFRRSRSLPVRDLEPGERYYIRTRSWTLFGGFTPYRLDSVFIAVPPLTQPVLELVDGISAQSSTVYANQEIYTLECSDVVGANEYSWQFDIEGDFFNPELAITTSSHIVSINTSNLVSGQAYFVRIQARNIFSGDETDINSISVQYFNSLHALGLALYGNIIDRRSFKLWAGVVENGDEYIFQVAEDPAFVNIFENPSFPETQCSWPGVNGVVFKANRDWYESTGWEPSNNPIIYKSFDFIKELNSGQVYYFRVRAANSNQLGYWGPIHQILVDPPPLLIDIESISHGSALPFDLDVYFVFTLTPNYDLTSVDFQLALDSGFNGLVFNGSMLSNTRSLRLPSIDYNTTYYARVRAYASSSPSSPSEWSSTTTFTTQLNPFPENKNDIEVFGAKSKNPLVQDKFNPEYAAYPNPFNDTFTLNLMNQASFVRVYDFSGNLLINREHVNRGNLRIGENLPSGIYLLKIDFEDKLAVSKMIKE